MAVPPLSAKDPLRVEALVKRRNYARALTPTLRAEQEFSLAEIVLPKLSGANAIGFYHPMRDEISPLALLDRIGPGRIAGLPWFGGRNAHMMFRQAPASEIGPWGVLQPSSDVPAVAPDTVIVPLVLVDRHGNRIGHGKGHYDRALANLRDSAAVRTIGIAWDIQISEVPISPDPWDVPLNAVATPSKWIDCR